MKGKIWINVGRVLLILFALMQAGVFMALRTRTMVNPWIVVIVSAVLSFPVSMLCANKAKGIIPFRNRALRAVAWMVLLIPVLTGSFYGINYQGADQEKATSVSATVARKYYETRERTRRVRRGRYAPTGEKYQVYYADIRLDNGHIVTVPLTGSNISRVHDGQSLEVKVAKGTFGIPVVITRDIFNKQHKNETEF